MQKNLNNLIAVVGMAGLFPGAADIDIFWHNIVNKVDATCDVPAHRWIAAADSMVDPRPMPDKAYSLRSCLLSNFHLDPEGINIDKDLLSALDPLHQVVLHVGKQALANSSLISVNRDHIGVVLASIALPTDSSSFISRKILSSAIETKLFASRFPDKFNQTPSLSRSQSLAARVTGLPASILAKGLGLGGGSYTLDAACASSLYAVKLAGDELRSHRADTMLAGGVSRPECLYTQVGFSQLRALSPSGRCAPFDRSADGLVVGEGAGILVLRRLTDALRDGNHILGVIHGIGLSNDMRGNLLAPDSEGQLRAMGNAYASAGWSPHSVDLIECHGAGTPVGDMTELKSLCSLWGNTDWVQNQCAIGSVKSMIGHLLTAAGSAGMIKTILALQHKTLPPTINFKSAAPDSPLNSGPFRVQTDPEIWQKRNEHQPRRAAISAFGFGGINAHLLLEEWDKNSELGSRPETGPAVIRPSVVSPGLNGSEPNGSGPNGSRSEEAAEPKAETSNMEIPESSSPIPNSPVAIIGMETVFGSLPSLRAFQEAVLNGRTNISDRPRQRWKDCDNIAEQYLGQHHMPGGFIKELTLNVGEFRIPPNEIRDILPQQLLMLKVAANALLDAGLPLRDERPNMGSFIGIDFDFEATNFHLRWYLEKAVANWQANYGLDIEAHETAKWIGALKDACGPPLTASRTLGALGGIVASRIAREFGFGGPSFVVSCEEASGLKALEVAVRSLQQHETDTALVGAVDLRGDIRNIVAADIIKPFSNAAEVQPFDRSAQGSLPGEGAAALVLKRLDRATADEDRIYAIIKGFGSATGGGIDEKTASSAAYKRSLEMCFQDADTSATAISFIEAHGSGDPDEDRLEADALHEFFEDNANQPAIGSTKPNIGHTGAVSGLGSLVKTAVCLYHEIIPPLRNFTHPQAKIRQENLFHFPVHPQYWFRNRKDGPRKALSSAITPDGNCMHVILEEVDNNWLKPNSPLAAAKIEREKRKPLGFSEYGLFVVEGNDKAAMISQNLAASDDQIQLTLGGKILSPTPPIEIDRKHESATKRRQIEAQKSISEPDHDHTPAPNRHHPASPMGHSAISRQHPNTGNPVSDLIEQLNQNMATASEAHQTFLDLSNEITQNYAKTFALQTQLLELSIGDQPSLPPPLKTEIPVQKPAYDRELCLEFARGSVAKVLGFEFAEVDTYAARVRLPDEPLMLVDRILSVQGEKASLGPGRVVTEHDVRPGAWYLDGGHAPVCISVEAGQADLFLCSFLGIDLKVKGRRTYRLLDATVKFHRELPRPGETIRYEIEIEKFIRQGDTYLFLFQFAGYIGSTPLITMTNGCAGFFTAEEVTNSGGIIFTEDELKPLPGKKPSDWQAFVPVSKESYDDKGVNALREGNLAACFGHHFDGIELPESLRLPGGHLNLIDRIVDLDANGGQFGLGRIRAEADIHPDDWFLTCHFVDDRVMPGTLMYECCVHTLRVFLLRVGWVTDKPDVSYEPVPGIESTLKCRGPVTPETRHVIYEVDIKEIGYAPQPYVIADAHMYADGHRIVWFKDMCLQMNNVTRHEIEKFWEEKQSTPNNRAETEPTIFNRDHLIEFATGNPSKAFGAPYKPFDQDRFIARLPAPPYLFMDRLTHIEPSPWVLKPDGWIESEYDVTPDAWYVKADRSRSVPISIIMEIALQPCGWLAAYMGSALKSTNDLRFRNLGGNAVLHTEILADAKKTLTVCSRLTQVSEAGEMIIEHFDFEVLHNKQKVYTGNTYFGFFSDGALAQQEGIRDAQQLAYQPTSMEGSGRKPYLFQDESPLRPDDQKWTPGPAMAYPTKAIRMIDRVHVYEPNGGPEGSGFVSGTKSVNPNEWFFKAHFYQDPVCPGSLGIESFVQLLKFVARNRWPHLKETHRFRLISGERQNWTYRGQILRHNKEIAVEAIITRVQETPLPTIMADGYLKVDELYIYKMENFGIQLVPVVDA